MAMKIKAVFKFKPFSIKQKKVLTWWCDNSPVKDKDGIIADGAIRSGKTISMALSFVMWAMFRFDGQNFGMCGKTIGSFRRNVVFWLKIMLRTRGYKVHDARADNLLIIKWKGKTNYFYIFGGKDERSQDLIQGITLAGIFFDEVALMPESFVKQGTGRCSVEGSKFWFNCNPEGPRHWFKVEWIDKRKEKNLIYLHFTMDDNLSLSEKIKERYRSMYVGLFFKRFILGLWVLAEGAIYDMWDETKHVIKDPKLKEEIIQRAKLWYISNDYGTGTVFVLGLFCVYQGKKYLVKSFYWDAKAQMRQKTDGEYVEDLKSLISFVKPKPIQMVIIPDDALSFIAECKKKQVSSIRVFKRDPGTVIDGIRKQANALSKGEYFIFDDKSNWPVIEEYSSYVWDPKAQERGEDAPLKQNDHGKDMERYFITMVSRSLGITSETYV
jgi:PBSX family phage terminase large subunit